MTSEYVIIGQRPWEAKIFLDQIHGDEVAEIKKDDDQTSFKLIVALSGPLLRKCMASFVLFQSLY